MVLMFLMVQFGLVWLKQELTVDWLLLLVA